MIKRLLRTTIHLGSILFSLAIITAAGLFIYMELNLPNVEQLNQVQLQVPLRIYSKDHKLIAEFGEKRRIPVTLKQIPKQLIEAVLATEDQRFYEHEGVDPLGLARAAVELIVTGRKVQGGSTITMQVARNYFLTRKKTYIRKFNEILLAIKIDHAFSKDRILELYLNKIFFGNRAYGVAAAAQVYYGKPLNELTLAQMAMLAGLPKAPSSLNPLANPRAAITRRNHVLERMLNQKYISKDEFLAARAQPVTARYHGATIDLSAPYAAEMVRQELFKRYGDTAYTKGFQVITSIDSHLQQAANKAVHDALLGYDQRHGYRGPLFNLGQYDAFYHDLWQQALSTIPNIKDLMPAAVTKVNEKSVDVLMADGNTVTIPWAGLSWARKKIGDAYLGKRPTAANDILHDGDVIRIRQVATKKQPYWALTQTPQVQGALVALNPHDGGILALEGGFNYHNSHFNRVTQAERQVGSAIKPFLYTAALAHGMTLATVINDAPVVVNDPSEEQLWRPQNDNRVFNGPTRLRIGLIRSRNLVSIRILENIGIPYAKDYIARFGLPKDSLPDGLSLALGSSTLTPLQLANGYAMLANGGFRVHNYLIDNITDADDHLVYQAYPDTVMSLSDMNNSQVLPAVQIISPQVAYLMNLAMRDVIKHGTGRRALILKRNDLAGKTGTTNKQNDAWFSGFNPDVVATAWVGYDNPKSLHEYGAQAALPMWIDFMGPALKDKAEHPLMEPQGLTSVRIDADTGLAAKPGDKKTLFETFRAQYAPKPVERTYALDQKHYQAQQTQDDSGEHLF